MRNFTNFSFIMLLISCTLHKVLLCIFVCFNKKKTKLKNCLINNWRNSSVCPCIFLKRERALFFSAAENLHEIESNSQNLDSFFARNHHSEAGPVSGCNGCQQEEKSLNFDLPWLDMYPQTLCEYQAAALRQCLIQRMPPWWRRWRRLS